MITLFLDDVITWISYAWWIWLIIIAWWYYNWAKEHVGFSPVLTLVIGGLLVYYLVIDHPLIGSLGVMGWVLLSSGILYFLPVVKDLVGLVLPKQKPPQSTYR
ncbi:MAG: hypothetical protein ABH803_01320 [Candidatus Micrarchaeota archaeon]